MAKSAKVVTDEIRAVIDEAVKRAVLQLMNERKAMPDDCYKQTIRRLKALPVLQERIADNKARLAGPMQNKSTSIVRYTASGVRADPEEMLEAMRQTMAAHIAADEAEVEEVTTAMNSVSEDAYFPALYDSFILRKGDDDIAEQLHCDKTTVYRHRKRLTRIVALRLYGAAAL